MRTDPTKQTSIVIECGKDYILKLKLDRPLVIFDIESTGTNYRTDRIVEIAFIILRPDGSETTERFLVNPEMPIPAEVTKIHGISDADVRDAPTFKALAPKLYALLQDCDLGGYNLIRFDIPMLIEEFLRASINFSLEGRRVVDAQRIFHKNEPRDLTAALAFYCGGTVHVDAHGAVADARATLQVLEGELDRYPDLPRTMVELDAYCSLRETSWVDREGKFKLENGEVIINFGKKKGESLKNLVRTDPGFLRWILKSDFSSDTKDVVRKALESPRGSPLGAGLADQLK
jgi:DNA polymerase-3 subunit epsilon